MRLAAQEEELLQKSHQFRHIRGAEEMAKAELEAVGEALEQAKRKIKENQEKAIALRGSLSDPGVTSTGEDEGSQLLAEKKSKEAAISRVKSEITALKEQVKSAERSRKGLKKKEEQGETVARRIKGAGNVEEELLKWKSAAEKLKEVTLPSIDLKALKTEKENLIKQVKAAKSALTTSKTTLSGLRTKQVALQSQHSQAQSSLTQVGTTQTKALFQALQSTPRLSTLLPARSFHVPVTPSIAEQLIASEEDRERTSGCEEVSNEKEWEKCLGLDKGTVYESWDVKVGFCRMMWGSEARIVLQIEGIDRESVSEVTAVPVTAEEYSLSVIQLKGVEGKSAIWVVSCICYKAFASSPTVHLRYRLHSTPHRLLLLLPLTVVDLIKPSKLLSNDPESLWNSLKAYETKGALSDLSSLTPSDIAELLKYHGAFNVLTRQDCQFISPDGNLGLGAFQSKPALAMIWRRGEESWELAVRSPSAKLRTALVHALTCQFSF